MPKDQVEVTEGNESGVETTKDTQEAQTDQEQSSDSKNAEEKAVFKDSFGNEYTADEFQAKFNEIQGSYTRKAQEASSYQKELDAIKKQSEADARKSVSESNTLKNVPQDVKEAIISIVKPLIEEDRLRIKQEEDQRKADQQFKSELDNLEKEFDGKNGKPKFDRNEVLRAMKAPENRIYDPRAKFWEMHRDTFNDLLIKEALAKQKGGNDTEDTSGDHSKPVSHTPKTWEQARKASLARLSE